MVTRLACIAHRFLGGEACRERSARESLECHARILKEMDEKGLRCLLQGQYGRTLPAQAGLTHLIVGVGHHIQCDLADLCIRPEKSAGGKRHEMGAYDAREWEFAEEEVCAALVLANFAKCEGAGTVAAFLALTRLFVGI